jgi:hypothetical protein
VNAERVAEFSEWLRSLPPDAVAAIGAIYPDSPPGGEWVDEADLAARGEPLAVRYFSPAACLELLAEHGLGAPPGLS